MQRSNSIFYVILLGLLYGSSLVASRFSVGQYEPLVYISLRLILAAIAYLAIYVVTIRIMHRRRWPTDRALWGHSALLAILGTALPMTAIVSSLQYQSSGVTSMLITLNPAVTVLLAHFFLSDESLTMRKFVGIVVALAGAGLLFVRGETGLAAFVQADWRGYGWVALGIFSSASAGVYARRFLRSADSFDVSSIRILISALVLVPIVYFTVGYDLGNIDNYGYSALLYAALVGTFAGMWLGFLIIKRYGATTASQTAYVIPVVTTILGAIILDEHVTPVMLIGMSIILLGIALLNSKGSKRRRSLPFKRSAPSGVA